MAGHYSGAKGRQQFVEGSDGRVVGAIDQDIDLGLVLPQVGRGRQQHIRVARVAVAQDDQPARRHRFRQRGFPFDRGGGDGLQPRQQGGEDLFADGGH